MHALDSAYAKIARAKAHKEALYQEIRGFLKGQPYSVAVETDHSIGKHIWRLKGTPTEPPPHLHPLIGEVFYHLRSALDHLAWQLVLVNGNVPDERTAFPVFRNTSKFASGTPREVRGMSDPAIALIKSEQPGIAPNLTRSRTLMTLHELNIVDKHRHFNIVVAGYLLNKVR